MNKRRLLVVAVLWTTSLLGVGLWAQGRRGDPDVQVFEAPVISEGKPYGPVLSGENIGFQRIYNPADKEGSVSGRLVVRINGEWLVATSPVTFRSIPLHR
jgi:hypothetical protein